MAKRKAEQVTQAVVLAAGKGERLYPLTTLRPKVMLPIANKPILQYVIEALAASAIREAVIVVGYHREQIQDHFGSGERFGIRIRYATQEHQPGTSHALLCAQELVDERFLVLPGDNIINQSTIQDLVYATQDTVLVKEGSGYHHGVVVVNRDFVQGFVEEPQEPMSPWVNTGIYLLHDTVFDHLPRNLNLPTALHHMVQEGYKVTSQETKSTWWDTAYPWDLLKVNGLALAEMEDEPRGVQEPGVVIKGPVRMGKTSVLRANSYVVGPVIIGEGCEIGPSVALFPYTSIGNNVVIDSFTQLRNCIIDNSVQLGSHSHLRESIIAEGCTIGPHFTAPCGKAVMQGFPEPLTVQIGSIVADHAEIGANVALRPGLIVGHGARIREMNQVREDVPDQSVVV